MAVVSSTDLGDGPLVVVVDHDPLSVATDVPSGSLIIFGGAWHRKLDDGATTNVLRMPTGDGSADQVITTDGSGALLFRTASNIANLSGYVRGGQVNFVSVTQVSIGVTGIDSAVRDSIDALTINWNGTLPADITVSGVGGLDTGAETADTWYAVYVIADSTEVSSPAALLSLSSTSPTLPAGYDRLRRLGWVRNDGSSDFRRFIEYGGGRDRKYLYDGPAISVLSLGADLAYTAVDCSSGAPPTAISGVFRIEGDLQNATRSFFVRPADFTDAVSDAFFWTFGFNNVRVDSYIDIPFDPNQLVEYKVENATDKVTLDLQGFRDSV